MHTNPLSSPDWHRVAHLKPRLIAPASCTRQWVRGQRWHVLLNPITGQSCRLNPMAYNIAARLDGHATLHTLWSHLDGGAGDQTDAPTQDDIVAVLHQLQGQQLIEFDEAPDFGTLQQVGAQHSPQASVTDREPALLSRLLVWRLPLGNPSAWLDRCAPLARFVFSKPGLLVWALLMVLLLFGMALHSAALMAHASAWMHTPRHLTLALVLYPAIKGLHEAAHALAVRRWGGSVREAGVTLLMLMPVPYVDASEAAAFRHAWQRMLVSAAGIMAELAMASLGLWTWQNTTDGLWHDAGFVVWFTACLSTLLFNANPLQRLDGYHVMTDALHLPNLAPRSQQWWQGALAHWLSAAPSATNNDRWAPLTEAPGERPWLIAYAPLALLYQWALWLGIVLWLGGLSTRLGWAVATLAIWFSVIRPTTALCQLTWQAALHTPSVQRSIAWRRASLLLGLPVIALILPWPASTRVSGVVWAPEQALIRTEIEGFIETLHRHDNTLVKAGDLLVTLRNPRLLAQRERLNAQLMQAEQDQFSTLDYNPGRAGRGQDEVLRLQAQIQHVENQIAALQITARRDGRLALPDESDLPGRYLHRGDLLGHVLTGDAITVRVAVRESDAVHLRHGLHPTSVQLSSLGMPTHPGHVLRDAQGAVRQLPSAALSEQLGGAIATDPKDTHNLRTVWPVVLMDVQLNDTTQVGRLGERAWVRFDQGWAPWLVQGWRWAARQVDTHFNAAH